MADERLLNQDIRFMRNKAIFDSRDAAIAKLNTIPQKIGQPLAHLYKLSDGLTVKCFLSIGLKDNETGPQSYQIIANDIDLSDLTHYTNEEPLVKAIGGLKVGQTFENVPLKQMWTDLLYPYIEPTISLSASIGSSVREKGTALTNIIFTANVGKKSKPLREVKFKANNSEVSVVTNPPASDGQVTYTHPRIDANTTMQASVSDGQTTIQSNSIAYTFVYPAYVGKQAVGITEPTGDEIKAMSKKIQNPANLANTFTLTNERMCIATPPGWTIASVIDPNGFNITDSFTRKTVSVACTDGQTIAYNVLISEPTTQSGFKVTFNKA